MKRIFALLLIFTFLTGLAACGGNREPAKENFESDAPDETNTSTSDETESGPEDNNFFIVTVPSQTQPEPESSQAAPQETSAQPSEPEETENTEELVTVRLEENIVYDDSVNSHYDLRFSIPQINLDSADAQAANEDIETRFVSQVEQARQAQAGRYSPSIMGIYYESWQRDGLLTVLIHGQSMTNNDWFGLYIFDVATGAHRNNDDMAALLGTDRASLDARIADTLGNCYRDLYGSMADEDPLFEEQYDRTVSGENLAAAQVYVDQDGVPYVLGTVYSLAGAYSYDRLLPLE